MKTQGQVASKVRLGVLVAAALLIAAFPAKAMAEDQQMADPPSGQMVEAVWVNAEMVQQALADSDGDDSQLGDQPGDVNEPDEIVPPDASGEDENLEAPGDPVEPPDTPGDDGGLEPQTPPSAPETVTVPSIPETGTPKATSKPRPRKSLPFTGGNELFYWLAGGLVMAAGVAVPAIRRPRKRQ